MNNSGFPSSFRKPLLSVLLFWGTFHFSVTAQPTLEIWEIQGNGASSPYEGDRVRTAGNIVTAVSEDGFFIQTPPQRSDGDPLTSDGIFVFTGDRPDFKAGDSLTVTGTILEYEGLTEFGRNISVDKLGTGVSLPDPVILNEAFPSTAPSDPPSLERVEGMRVSFEGVSSGPTNPFGEFSAVATQQRAFREPGILRPGIPGLPVWDGNPEIFRIDPDGAGAPDNRLVSSNVPIASTGVMTFSFGAYTLYPESYSLDNGTMGKPVRSLSGNELTVGSINTLFLIRGESGYETKLEKLAAYIIDYLQAPDILALQEVGSLDALDDLAARIRKKAPDLDYSTHLGDGGEDIRLGFMTLNTVVVESVQSLGVNENFSLGGPLHNRPPLLLTAALPDKRSPELQVLNVHFRSLLGIEGADSVRVRQKRYEQSLSVARMVQERQADNLLVIGDFNAFQFSDGYVDIVNQVAGLPSLGATRPVQNIVDPPLRNLSSEIETAERYSYLHDGSAQLIDHCLVNRLPDFGAVELQYARANADFPESYSKDPNTPLGSSDHDGFVVFLRTDPTVATTVPKQERDVSLSYANPLRAGDPVQVHIKSGTDVRIRLMGTDGRMIGGERPFSGPGQHTFSIPANLPAGWYVLRIFGSKEAWSELLVVGK